MATRPSIEFYPEFLEMARGAPASSDSGHISVGYSLDPAPDCIFLYIEKPPDFRTIVRFPPTAALSLVCTLLRVLYISWRERKRRGQHRTSPS